MLDHDDDTLQYLLNGRKPRYRRDPRPKRRAWTELTNSDGIEDDYARLLATQHNFLTVEEAELAAFDWATLDGISYDDAAAWFHQGATYQDRRLLRELIRVGVTPAVTAKSFRYPNGVRVTVMTALLRRHVRPTQIATQMRHKAAP